jgi:hypothetical protein
METMRAFFDAWDDLEAANPFGVMYFRPLLLQHGVSEAMAGDVDEFLYMDLMTRRMVHIRRIKVQARITEELFWVYLDLRTSTLSFQSMPSAPFTYSTTIVPEPAWLMRLIMAYYRQNRRKALPIMQRHRNFDAYVRRAQ